ncbi:MAG: hypothetical protein ACTSXP_00070 [Promethearchaeota archaeon]
MPISKTIENTIKSTYIINKGMSGIGTGFFITPDGYFITAGHVAELVKEIDGKITIEQAMDPSSNFGYMIQYLEIVQIWKDNDIALLKADFEKKK